MLDNISTEIKGYVMVDKKTGTRTLKQWWGKNRNFVYASAIELFAAAMIYCMISILCSHQSENNINKQQFKTEKTR